MRYGTPEQQARWLTPLLAGEIRSCFAMTEPAVASSDATNVQASIVTRRRRIRRQRAQVVHDGRHRSALQDRIFMGKTDPANPDRHLQQSMILVPMDTPGVKVVRPIGGLRLLRRAGPRVRSHVRQRARAGVEHAARRRARLRDRAGAAGAGPHSSLHAADRPVRAHAGADVQAHEVARGVRQADRRPGRHARAHR